MHTGLFAARTDRAGYVERLARCKEMREDDIVEFDWGLDLCMRVRVKRLADCVSMGFTFGIVRD